MDTQIWCLLTTVDSANLARQMAREAVEAKLAACVQIEDGITSVYRWKDATESATESRLLFKLDSAKMEPLRAWLRERHPYDVPEILAWPAPEVDPAYAEWVREG
jgi:periplasmic divalent cation tolerance protein